MSEFFRLIELMVLLFVYKKLDGNVIVLLRLMFVNSKLYFVVIEVGGFDVIIF